MVHHSRLPSNQHVAFRILRIYDAVPLAIAIAAFGPHFSVRIEKLQTLDEFGDSVFVVVVRHWSLR